MATVQGNCDCSLLSFAQSRNAIPISRRLLMHCAPFPFFLAPESAGSKRAAKTAIIAMTTSNSTTVKPCRRRNAVAFMVVPPIKGARWRILSTLCRWQFLRCASLSGSRLTLTLSCVCFCPLTHSFAGLISPAASSETGGDDRHRPVGMPPRGSEYS